MNNTEIPELARLLAEHYEVYSKRPPEEKAVQAWFRTIKPLPIAQVRDALVAHSRKGKFPATPAHVFEFANTQNEAANDEKLPCKAALDAEKFWHANDLLMAAHMGWSLGPQQVREQYDEAMVNACDKAKTDHPDLPLPDAMRAMIAKLPGKVFPRMPA